jgi:putative DNA-invertase from lambdoid prophage Rac
MAIYGYSRVSTGRQAAEGDSLGAQERQLGGYAMQHGWTLAEVFREEGVSGAIPLADRPAGARLLAVLRAGDVIVAPKLDRIFRSALDALRMVEELKDHGVSLHLLDLGGDVAGNGLSKLFLTVAAAFAEAERDRIRERVAGTKADQRARGRYLGGIVPYGHRVGADGALEPVPEQQEVIGRARALREEGKPLRAIRAALAADGVSLSLDALHRIVRDAAPVPKAAA